MAILPNILNVTFNAADFFVWFHDGLEHFGQTGPLGWWHS